MKQRSDGLMLKFIHIPIITVHIIRFPANVRLVRFYSGLDLNQDKAGYT